MREQPMRLLNPGPVTLSDRVRQALLSPDLCHREPEFSALQHDVRERLARVYDGAAKDYAAVLLTGSGTAAVEAMIGTLVPKDGKALVVANGVYGERIASMLEIHGKAFEMVASEWTAPMRLDEIARRLDADGAFTHVVAVHHETTTGRLNDLGALGALCRERGVPLLLDAVSSFGGEPIAFDEWNLEACAATANKCLHGVPGFSFVLARRQTLETRVSGATSLYLDLIRNYQEQVGGSCLFTPAVQVLFALREALVEFEQAGGWTRRHQHYRALSAVVRTGLARLGVKPLLDDVHDYSATLTSFHLPAGVKFQRLFTELKQSRFVIYPGQRGLDGKIFRVAVMGDLDRDDMEQFVAAVAAVLKDAAPAARAKSVRSEAGTRLENSVRAGLPLLHE